MSFVFDITAPGVQPRGGSGERGDWSGCPIYWHLSFYLLGCMGLRKEYPTTIPILTPTPTPRNPPSKDLGRYTVQHAIALCSIDQSIMQIFRRQYKISSYYGRLAC